LIYGGEKLKKGIHPEYVECVVTCACGETFETRSTKGKISVGICSRCHPFYTGTQKLVDSAGRVEKFKRRYGWKDLTPEGEKETAEEPEKSEEATKEKPEGTEEVSQE